MKTTLKFFTHFLLLGCFCLAFISCKKLQGEGWTKVEGQAVDKFTGEPVPFARIKVETRAGGFTPIPGSGTAKEKIADANGKFEFSFEADSENDYQLTGYLEDRYFVPEEPIGLNAARKNKNLKLKLQPLAWAKIKVVNEPPLDTAWLHISGGGFFYVNGNATISLHGISRDTTIIWPLAGGLSSQVFGEIIKIGSKKEFRQSLFFLPLDTTIVEIRY